MAFLKNIYLTDRFFISLGIIIGCFCLSFFIPVIFYPSIGLLVGLFLMLIYDIFKNYKISKNLTCNRNLPNMFSLSDENKITIDIHNDSKHRIDLEFIDEIPVEFQIRLNSIFAKNIGPESKYSLFYTLRPLQRGEYQYGNTNVFISSILGLIQYRKVFKNTTSIKVYPSIIQMYKYELKMFNKTSYSYGTRKLRRLGQSYEFEKIRNYVEGDDIRSINWKATCRKNTLMVNQYEDEKSQNIYIVIDKSRSMMLTFDGLTLLDYSINTGLALSNIVIKKNDKAGLISFSNKIETTIKSDSGIKQLNRILESLYNETENTLEANYDQLYSSLTNTVKTRSLIFLFANFESYHSIKRVIDVLQKINKRHLLVLMIFENTEITNYSRKDAKNLEELYLTTIAEKFMYDKYRILNELRNIGIQVVINKPYDLSINAINKYTELKSKGLI